MSFKIERNVDGNFISFKNSTAPIYFNSALQAEHDASDANLVNVVNLIATGDSATKSYEYFQIPYTDFVDANGDAFATAVDCVDYFNTQSDITTNKNGYFFQNSHYYTLGSTHVGNPDVLEEVEVDVATTIKFSGTGATETGTTSPIGIAAPYLPATGVFTLTGAVDSDFLLFRISVDILPETDQGSALISLLCTPTIGSSFTVSEEILDFNRGAGFDYNGLATIPIFVGDILRDRAGEGGTTATIVPQITLKNTDGDIKPVTISMYGWRK